MKTKTKDLKQAYLSEKKKTEELYRQANTQATKENKIKNTYMKQLCITSNTLINLTWNFRGFNDTEYTFTTYDIDNKISRLTNCWNHDDIYSSNNDDDTERLIVDDSELTLYLSPNRLKEYIHLGLNISLENILDNVNDKKENYEKALHSYNEIKRTIDSL